MPFYSVFQSQNENTKKRHGAGKIKNSLWELDRILRGGAGDEVSDEDRLGFPMDGLTIVLGILGGSYGLCMGVFAILRGADSGAYSEACLQMFSSVCKVPLLFSLTLLVTFPSLYVFNALMGSSLKIASVFRLLIASLAINVSVLASLGPVAAFFSLSSSDYGFIVLLHVLIFSISGFLGLAFLARNLRLARLAPEPKLVTIVEASLDSTATNRNLGGVESSPSTGQKPAPVTNRRSVDWFFFCWMVAFGLVGAQMGWIMRPFIGAPNLPFELVRERQSNFFSAVWRTLVNVLS